MTTTARIGGGQWNLFGDGAWTSRIIRTSSRIPRGTVLGTVATVVIRGEITATKAAAMKEVKAQYHGALRNLLNAAMSHRSRIRAHLPAKILAIVVGVTNSR